MKELTTVCQEAFYKKKKSEFILAEQFIAISIFKNG